MIRAAGLAACILLGGCQQATFFCDTPEDCASEGGGGACESTGYCSFPDPECDTGRRYGDLAPMGLAGTCVPRTGDTEGSSGSASTSGSTTDPTDPTLAETTTSSSTTTTGSSTTSGSEDDTGSSTGGEPVCCDASCSTCEGSCEFEVLDSRKTPGEALAIAVIGTTLVWTTGYAQEVFTVDLTTGDSTLLTTVPHIITNITSDDEYIYYLSYSNGFVGRISLASGALTIVTDADSREEGVEYSAGYGQIVLDGPDVYFALANTAGNEAGGAFRAPKLPSALPPERIGAAQGPIGIGVDEDSIYIADQVQQELQRFDKAAPGAVGETMLPVVFPGHIYVSDSDVYTTGAGQLTRVPKDGSASTLLVTTGGEIRGITGDEAHVYITDLQSGSVTRVSRFDTEPPVQIASSPEAWGIATDCTHVYWCENGTLSVLRQPK